MKKWRIEDSEELYGIKGWGVNYFGINEKGHVYVTPRKNGTEVDLKELVDELAAGIAPAGMRGRADDEVVGLVERHGGGFAVDFAGGRDEDAASAELVGEFQDAAGAGDVGLDRADRVVDD